VVRWLHGRSAPSGVVPAVSVPPDADEEGLTGEAPVL